MARALIRDKRTGIYHTSDKRFEITRGAVGWNVSEIDDYFTKRCGTEIYRYSFSTMTLKEAKNSLD